MRDRGKAARQPGSRGSLPPKATSRSENIFWLFRTTRKTKIRPVGHGLVRVPSRGCKADHGDSSRGMLVFRNLISCDRCSGEMERADRPPTKQTRTQAGAAHHTPNITTEEETCFFVTTTLSHDSKLTVISSRSRGL